MVKKIIVIILVVTFVANTGQSQAFVKGKPQFITDVRVVAQKIKGGVLLWSRDDIANGRTWRDANSLIFLRLNDTRGIKKGTELGDTWVKYIGTYRHGNCLAGYRDIPAFEVPSKAEVEQEQYEEKRRHGQERMKVEIERRKAFEQRRLEDEQKRIKDQAEQEKIERELQRQREENDRKLAAARAKAEIESERQRQEETRKAEEERKRRYPIEQKERAEYAKEMLSKMSFDVNSYFDIQRDLKRFIYSVSVTEKKWSHLKELQAKSDWLGMLNAMSESEMSDFPIQTQIKAIVENLKKAVFHAEFLFTHTDDKRHSGLHHRMCLGGVFPDDKYHPIVWDAGKSSRCVTWSLDNSSLVVTFSLNDNKNKFIHSEYPCPPGWNIVKIRDEQLKKINSDAELGRITQGEAAEERKKVEEDLLRNFSDWLATSKVRDEHYPVKVRERLGTNIDTGKSRIRNKSDTSSRDSKSQWVTCPDCNGSRYISKGKCSNCNGEGRYRTAVTRGIGGRPMGGTMRQCDKCKASGEIKELCKRCHGRGKFKQ